MGLSNANNPISCAFDPLYKCTSKPIDRTLVRWSTPACISGRKCAENPQRSLLSRFVPLKVTSKIKKAWVQDWLILHAHIPYIHISGLQLSKIAKWLENDITMHFFLTYFHIFLQLFFHLCQCPCSYVSQHLLIRSSNVRSNIQMLQPGRSHCHHHAPYRLQHLLPPPALHLRPVPGFQTMAEHWHSRQPLWLLHLQRSSRRAAFFHFISLCSTIETFLLKCDWWKKKFKEWITFFIALDCRAERIYIYRFQDNL